MKSFQWKSFSEIISLTTFSQTKENRQINLQATLWDLRHFNAGYEPLLAYPLDSIQANKREGLRETSFENK